MAARGLPLGGKAMPALGPGARAGVTRAGPHVVVAGATYDLGPVVLMAVDDNASISVGYEDRPADVPADQVATAVAGAAAAGGAVVAVAEGSQHMVGLFNVTPRRPLTEPVGVIRKMDSLVLSLAFNADGERL